MMDNLYPRYIHTYFQITIFYQDLREVVHLRTLTLGCTTPGTTEANIGDHW